MSEATVDCDQFYKLLRLEYSTSDSPSLDEIKKSYRFLAKIYHPDKTNGDKAKEEIFKTIDTAYKILLNPKLSDCSQCKKCSKIMPLNFIKELCSSCSQDNFNKEKSKKSTTKWSDVANSSSSAPFRYDCNYQKSEKQQSRNYSKDYKQYCLICQQGNPKPNQDSICPKCINTGLKCSNCDHIIDATKVIDILVQKKIPVSEIKCYKCLYGKTNYNHRCKLCGLSCYSKYDFCQICYHQSYKCCNNRCFNRIKDGYFTYLTQVKRIPVNLVKCKSCLSYS